MWSVPILRVTENPLTPLPPGMRQGEGPLLAGGPAPALTVGSSVPAESGPAWRIPRRRVPPAVRQGCSRAEAGTWADTPASLRFLFHHLQPFLWLLWLPHLKDDSNVECLAQGRRASQYWTLQGALSQPFRAHPLHTPSHLGQTVQQAVVKGRQRVFNALAVSVLPPGEWARPGSRTQGLHERLKRGGSGAGIPGISRGERARSRPSLVWGAPAAGAALGWRGAEHRVEGWGLSLSPAPQPTHCVARHCPGHGLPTGRAKGQGSRVPGGLWVTHRHFIPNAPLPHDSDPVSQ